MNKTTRLAVQVGLGFGLLLAIASSLILFHYLDYASEHHYFELWYCITFFVTPVVVTGLSMASYMLTLRFCGMTREKGPPGPRPKPIERPK